MNKKLLLQTMLLLCALVAGSGKVWADTVTFDATTDVTADAASYQQSENTYTAADGSEWIANGYGAKTSTYLVIGKGGANYLQTPEVSGKITSVTVTWYGNTSYYLALQTTTGTELEAIPNPDATTATEKTFTVSTGIYSQLRLVGRRSSGTNNAAATITKVVVTYAPISDPSKTAVSITDFVAAKTTLVKGETTTTSAANDQDSWIPSYRYSSNNETVATVDESGVITARAKGTALITATLNISDADATYTLGSTTNKSVEITVNNPSHVVTFSINGDTDNTATVEEDAAIEFPTVEDVLGMKAVAWVADAISGTQETAPEVMLTSATMGTKDVTYYAVFARVVNTIPESWTETALSEIGASDVFVFSNGAYALNNNNGTSSAPSANAITVADGKITSVVADNLKWKVTGNATDGYTFLKADDTTKWLYCNTTSSSGNNNNIRVGTGERKLWGFNNSNYLVTSDSYTVRYLSIYSSSDFRGYINTSNGAFTPIFYKYIAPSLEATDYCTAVATTKDIAITSVKYATFCSDKALDFTGTDVTAYTAKVDEGVVKLSQIDVVPANTGVILYAESADTYAIPVTTTDAVVSGNQLVGITAEKEVKWTTDDKYNYILQSNGAGGVVFNKATVDGAKLRANRAYLALDSEPAAPSLQIVFDNGMTTGISEAVKTVRTEDGRVYNLSGQRVVQPTKGLYIVNGKKMVIK